MEKRLFLFFSHRLTREQEEDGQKSLGIKEFVYLPENLQKLWSNVPPELSELGEYLKPFVYFLLEKSQVGDFILVQGDFGMVVKMVEIARGLGLVPIYATTKREVEEREGENGEIVKVSRFKHIRFRKF